MDQWDRKSDFGCDSCMFYVPKIEHAVELSVGKQILHKSDLLTMIPKRGEGRCRRNAPTMKGYPVVFSNDWCGEHKRGSNPVRDNAAESKSQRNSSRQ